jgi:uncharacterized protein (DUF885 family)
MKRTTYIVLLISALLLTGYSFHVHQKTHETIEAVFQDFFRESMEHDPEYATQLGVTEGMGISIRNDELTDVSIQAESDEYALYQRYRIRLEGFDPDSLTPSQRLDRELLLWHIDRKLEGEKFRYHHYLINTLFGIHSHLTTLMTEHQAIESLQDVQDYLARLKKYPMKFHQILEQLQARKERGIWPPRAIIQETETVMSDFIREKPKKNVLYISLKSRLDEFDSIEKGIKKDLLEQAETAIRDDVYPSYQKMIDHLQSLAQIADNRAGVWKLPDGASFYRYCLRFHTTSYLSPKEIHVMGLQEVHRIQKEMMEILIAMGIGTNVSFLDMLRMYWQRCWQEKQGEFYYADTKKGKEQALRDYQAIIDAVEKRLPQYFSLIPKTRVQVRAIPEFEESTSVAHYQRASLDGRRKGVFYANLSHPPFKPNMKTLTYHEAIPGHHFQIAISQESSENRLFRNLLFFTAYIEGWALYAERLALENGWFEDDHEKLGYLNSELLRAVRLVVDTGLHHMKWTREDAYRYMLQNLGWASYGSVDRHIIWPGQGCAYKIGELKILELRERSKQELESRFDIKEFHRVVLETGAVPLDVLERKVNQYILDKKHEE